MLTDPTEICFEPAVNLAQLIRERQLSVTEVVDAYLRRIELRNPSIRAYVHVMAESAEAQARQIESELEVGRVRPLSGVPVAIKDLEDIQGAPTTFGSRALLDNIAAEDAILTNRLRRAGAIFLGKTNTPEFGHKGVTDNLAFGPTYSPFGEGMSAGGSSGGAAAAVADGMAAIAQGGDGGGSLRIPASLCGAFGFKPTWGRVPHKHRPMAFNYTPLSCLGPIARTVDDAALMMSVISGPDRRDPTSLPDDGVDWLGSCTRPIDTLRIAYSKDLGGYSVDPEVTEVVEDALSAFVDAGATVESVDIGFDYSLEEQRDVWLRGIAVQYAQMVEGFRFNGRDLLTAGDGVEPAVMELIEMGQEMGAVEYKTDDLVRTHVFDVIEDVFDRFDLLVSPTLSVSAVPVPQNGLKGPTEVNGEAIDDMAGWLLTFQMNFTGHPSASLPAGSSSEGAPVGMQVTGPRFADATVLAACATFERARPWRERYPGLEEISKRER